MTNLAETPVWRTGVFQLETTTPVRGGVAGESNTPLLNLADRTAYLKQEVDALVAEVALRAPIASPDFTGAPLATTPGLDDDSRRIVTTEWVRDFLGSVTAITITGGNTTLTAIQAARGLIVVTGTLTAPATLILPAGSVGRWTIYNATTGAFSLSARLSGTTNHPISTGAIRSFWSEGTTLRPTLSEAVDIALLGTPTAPTAAASVNNTQVATTAYARRFARGATSKAATGGATITLTDEEAAVPVILLTGSPASPFTVVFPAEGARWDVRNATGQAATLKTAAQVGGITLGAGHSTTAFADGANLRAAPTETHDHRLAGAPEATTPSPSAAGEEVVTAAWVRSLLTGQAIYSTGDFKFTLKATPDTGWVFLDGKTIGKAGSGATARANADTEPLYTLIWNNLPDPLAPVTGGRGASAAADFAAGKTLALPNTAGRALAGAGAGPGLTARALGAMFGAESHVLTIAQMPQHDHTGSSGGNGWHAHTITVAANGEHVHGAWTAGAGAHGHSAWTDHQGDHTHGTAGKGGEGGGIDPDWRPGNTNNYILQYGGTDYLRTSTAGGHSHNVGIGGIGDHAHGVGISAAGNHAHTAWADAVGNHQHTIPAQGNNQAHPTIGPAIAFNVMVKL